MGISELKAQITKAQNKFKYSKWPIYKKFAVGTWVEYTTGGGTRTGQIIEKSRKKLEVMEWKRTNKRYLPYKRKTWKKKNTTEARLILNDKRNKILHIQGISPKENSSDDEEHPDGDVQPTTVWENEGLWHLSWYSEPYYEIMDRANSPDEIIHGVSDGSVRESQEEGTFAWALLNKNDDDTYEPMGVSAQGWEGLYK